MQYTDRATAPLKWHYFTLFVVLPLSALSNAYTLLTALGALTESDIYAPRWFSVLELVCLGLVTAATVFTILGLARWQARGWYGLFAVLTFTLVFQIADTLAQSVYYADLFAGNTPLYTREEGEALLASMRSLIVSRALTLILNFIYYRKRRPLFMDQQESTDPVTGAPAPHQTARGAAPLPPDTVIRCPVCGTSQLLNRPYCFKCGQELPGYTPPER